MDEELLVADELATLLRVEKYRIYELCRSDSTFPCILLGKRQYRFSRQAVERWIENGGSQKGVNEK